MTETVDQQPLERSHQSIRDLSTRSGSIAFPKVPATTTEPSSEKPRRGGHEHAHELPSQNQLYAVLMLACGTWRIRRPHRWLLSLVEDVDARPEAIAQRNGHNVPPPTAEDGDAAAGCPHLALRPLPPRTALARCSTLDFGNAYLGNTNLCALIDLMHHLPLLESVDWGAQAMYTADAYKQGVPGNEVLRRLFSWAAKQRSLRSVDLGRNPVGTRVLHDMIAAVKANPSLVDIRFDESGVEGFLYQQLQRALATNRSGRPHVEPPPYYRIAPELAQLEGVDRKTSSDRRLLHQLLWEFHAAFTDPMRDAVGGHSGSSGRAPAASSLGSAPAPTSSSPTEQWEGLQERFVSTVVATAHLRTSAEVVNACRGLRGDGGSLYVVDSGSLAANLGSSTVTLRRGDYFGEPLESEMYVGGLLDVDQRGTVFQIPHECVAELALVWERQVNEYLPLLQRLATFQSLPKWILIRACHEARRIRHAKGEVVIERAAAFSGLYVVTAGRYVVRGGPRGNGLSPVQGVDFTPGDVFGAEAAISRLSVSTVEVKAMSDECELVALSARHSRSHIIPPLRTILAIEAKDYAEGL